MEVLLTGCLNRLGDNIILWRWWTVHGSCKIFVKVYGSCSLVVLAVTCILQSQIFTDLFFINVLRAPQNLWSRYRVLEKEVQVMDCRRTLKTVPSRIFWEHPPW